MPHRFNLRRTRKWRLNGAHPLEGASRIVAGRTLAPRDAQRCVSFSSDKASKNRSGCNHLPARGFPRRRAERRTPHRSKPMPVRSPDMSGGEEYERLGLFPPRADRVGGHRIRGADLAVVAGRRCCSSGRCWFAFCSGAPTRLHRPAIRPCRAGRPCLVPSSPSCCFSAASWLVRNPDRAQVTDLAQRLPGAMDNFEQRFQPG